jgi:hypothetical protein
VKCVGYGQEDNQFIAKRDVTPGPTDEYWARVRNPNLKAKALLLRTIALCKLCTGT